MAEIKADKLDQARAYILARDHVALSAWIAENMPVGVDLVATAKMFDLLLKSDNDMHMSRAKKLFEALVDTYDPAAIRVGATVAVSWWLLKVAAVFGILYLVISQMSADCQSLEKKPRMQHLRRQLGAGEVMATKRMTKQQREKALKMSRYSARVENEMNRDHD